MSKCQGCNGEWSLRTGYNLCSNCMNDLDMRLTVALERIAFVLEAGHLHGFNANAKVERSLL